MTENKKIIFRKVRDLLQGPLLVLATGIFFIAFGTLKALDGFESLKWAAADAVITVSDKAKHFTRIREYYIYHFTYIYQVNGITYTGHRYSFASGQYDSSSGVEKYKARDRVTVFYDQNNPERSTVIRGPSMWLLLPILGGLIFTGGGFFWMKETLIEMG